MHNPVHKADIGVSVEPKIELGLSSFFVTVVHSIKKIQQPIGKQNPTKSRLMDYKWKHFPVYKADIGEFAEPKLELS